MKKLSALVLILLFSGCYPIVKFFTTDLVRGSVCDYAINLKKIQSRLSLAGYTFIGNKRTSRDDDWKTDKVVCNEFEKQVLSPFERFLKEKYPQTKIDF